MWRVFRAGIAVETGRNTACGISDDVFVFHKWFTAKPARAHIKSFAGRFWFAFSRRISKLMYGVGKISVGGWHWIREGTSHRSRLSMRTLLDLRAGLSVHGGHSARTKVLLNMIRTPGKCVALRTYIGAMYPIQGENKCLTLSRLVNTIIMYFHDS